ncbi:MAG: beta-galactosidase [Victivallales bacterium]
MKNILVALALLAPLGISADENIGGQASILTDDVSVNKGQASDLLQPVSKGAWEEMNCFSGQQTAEIWFNAKEAPTISHVACAQSFDLLQKGCLEYWDGGQWQKLVELPVSINKRGLESASTDIKLQTPVSARAVRIVMDKIADLDHSTLNLRGWNIQGVPGKGGILYDPSDLTLACKAEFNTFDLPGPAVVEVKIQNKSGAASKFKADLIWETFSGYPVDAPAAVEHFEVGKDGVRTLSAKLAVSTQGPYRLTVKLYDEERGVLVAAKRIVVGLRDPKIFASGTVAPLDQPGREILSFEDRLKRNGTIWGADVTQGMSGSGRKPGEGLFKKLKSAGGEETFTVLSYHDFEPLPGVYNLAYFDHVVGMARNSGMGLTVGVWWWDFGGPTQWWLADERVRRQDNTSGAGWESLFSVFSSKYRLHARRAMQAMVGRYVNTPEVWIWHPHPYGVVDHDGHGIFDYHPDALAAFAKYLEDKYKTVNALNAAYGSSFKSWIDVPVPRPLWEELMKKNDWEGVSRTLDTRPQWIDWLDFYHGGLLDMRKEMMKIVRDIDPKRALCGMTASGGVGRADDVYASLAANRGFYGDTGLNGEEIIRRFVGKQRYNLPLRCEDRDCVTLGRPPFDTKEKVAARANWDAYQSCVLGLDHFNYVFPTTDDSVFFDLVYANPRAKALIKESWRSKFQPRPVALLHSFLTDIYEGKYEYGGISIDRWWLMNGLSSAFYLPGNYFEIYSDGCPMEGFDSMKLVIDDGSRVLPEDMVDRLVKYVENGGRLAMICGPAGERSIPAGEEFGLLKRLGYKAVDKLSNIHFEPGQLVFAKDNQVLRRTVSIPIHFWRELEAPKEGALVGRIGKTPGAVVWPYGKGQVFLIGGRPGSVSEAEVLKMFSIKDKKDEGTLWSLWGNATRDCAGISKALLGDLAEWAGVPLLFEADPDFSSVMRNDSGKILIYLYNSGPDKIPVVRLSLPEGRYKIEAETLESAVEIGVMDSKAIAAPGIALPLLPKDKFMALRIAPSR